MILILSTLTGVVWIALALKQLNLMTTQGQEAWLFFKMTLLALPNLMALIAPIALLIASIHTLNRLNGDSELIVMTAGGATVWQFARPLLVLAVLVSICVAFVNHLAMPWSLRQLHAYINQVRTDLVSQVLRPGNFTRPESGMTIHIRSRDRAGALLGIMMQDERKPKEVSTYLAERGTIMKDKDGAFLMMTNGHIIRQAGDKPASVITFDQYPVDLARLEKKDAKYELKPRERYFSELAKPEKTAFYKANQGKFRSELHDRFATPFYPFAFVLIAIAFVGQAQTTRQNRVLSVVYAFLCAAGARLGGLAAMNLLTITPKAVPVVYAIPLAACFLAVVAAQYKMRPRKRSAIASWLGDRIEALIDRLAFWRRAAAGKTPSQQGAAS